MVTGFFVCLFVERRIRFIEHVPHLNVRDTLGNVGPMVENSLLTRQTVGSIEFFDLGLEFEFFKKFADFRRKSLDVSRQVSWRGRQDHRAVLEREATDIVERLVAIFAGSFRQGLLLSQFETSSFLERAYCLRTSSLSLPAHSLRRRNHDPMAAMTLRIVAADRGRAALLQYSTTEISRGFW